jgi:hypothetical protein
VSARASEERGGATPRRVCSARREHPGHRPWIAGETEATTVLETTLLVRGGCGWDGGGGRTLCSARPRITTAVTLGSLQ